MLKHHQRKKGKAGTAQHEKHQLDQDRGIWRIWAHETIKFASEQSETSLESSHSTVEQN